MTADPNQDASLFDDLVTKTDNGPEPDVPDPPQDPDWSPTQPAAAAAG